MDRIGKWPILGLMTAGLVFAPLQAQTQSRSQSQVPAEARIGEGERGPDASPEMRTIEIAEGPFGLGEYDPPVFRYANVYAQPDGETTVQHCAQTGMAFKQYAPPAAPQWVGIPPGDIESISYAVLPVGYVGDWHPSPGAQWVVVLEGRWSVETTDGTVLEQGPGEVQFNAEKGATDQGDGRIGHLTRQVGDVPTLQLIVALREGSIPGATAAPCEPVRR